MDVNDRYQHGTSTDIDEVFRKAIGAFSWVYAPEMYWERPRAYTYFYLTYDVPQFGNVNRFGWRIRLQGIDSDNECFPCIHTYNMRKTEEDPSWIASLP